MPRSRHQNGRRRSRRAQRGRLHEASRRTRELLRPLRQRLQLRRRLLASRGGRDRVVFPVRFLSLLVGLAMSRLRNPPFYPASGARRRMTRATSPSQRRRRNSPTSDQDGPTSSLLVINLRQLRLVRLRLRLRLSRPSNHQQGEAQVPRQHQHHYHQPSNLNNNNNNNQQQQHRWEFPERNDHPDQPADRR